VDDPISAPATPFAAAPWAASFDSGLVGVAQVIYSLASKLSCSGYVIHMHQRRLKRFGKMHDSPLVRILTLISGICVVPSLAGCVITGYEKPDLALEVPDDYRDGHGQKAPPELDWWRGFHSAELTDLIERAQSQNFDIAVAIAQIEQSDALVRQAAAPLFPLIDYNASVTQSQSAVSATGGGPKVKTTLYSTNLTASYVLDIWGKNRAALLAAQENSIEMRFAKEGVRLTTITTVADDYFTVIGTQDRVRIAHNNVAAAAHILDLVKLQAKVGTLSGLDIAQQEALLATERALIPPLELTVRQTIQALALLVGRAPEHVTVHGGSLTKLPTPRVTPGLPSDVLTQRPDIRQDEAQLASANYSVESARAAFFPTIQLTDTAGFQSTALKTLFGPGAYFYTAAASLTQPVFDGFQLLGQLEQQIALQKQFLQTYRKSVISAFVDVESALEAIEEDTRQERLQFEAVEASRRAFHLVEVQLQAGTVNLTTVLQAEQTLFTAEDTLAVVRINRFQAYIALYQALGGGWPPKVEIAREEAERQVEVARPIPSHDP
jgi:outer membrane protein, multidrug efflux system